MGVGVVGCVRTFVVVAHSMLPMGIDVLVLRLFLLEEILGHELLLLEGTRLIAGFTY